MFKSKHCVPGYLQQLVVLCKISATSILLIFIVSVTVTCECNVHMFVSKKTTQFNYNKSESSFSHVLCGMIYY